jgi:hypothetical protein
MKLPAKVKSVVDCITEYKDWNMMDNDRETTYTFDIIAKTNTDEDLPVGISVTVAKGEV